MGIYGFTCFINDKHGEDWSNETPEKRRKLAHAFNADPDSEAYKPLEFVEQVWQHEQLSRDALTPVTKIGHLVKYRDIYGKPIANMHFVGTEYATHWKGYTKDDLMSGDAGAKEVIRH